MPTMSHLKSFNYLNQIIKETLRVNPPLNSIVPRRAAENTVFRGWV